MSADRPVTAGAIREWRIGWHQGRVQAAVRMLDRLDPGWQGRPSTLRLLGLTERGVCTATFEAIGIQWVFCALTDGHTGAHKDSATGAVWWLAPETASPDPHHPAVPS